MNTQPTSLKRPRSPSEPYPQPAAKIPRTATNQLQIDYLAREHKETIPLVSSQDKLPDISRLLGEYDGVLQRHESLAGNLGACPVGPILVKRFEKMFDAPPKILKAPSKETRVSWLDVAGLYQNNPNEFTLQRARNGNSVAQFSMKGCRVEISEEDFVLIASGLPQKLIPPQPILEDEEKELGIIDILERNVGQVIHLADQVSGRARQFIHKLKGRRSAILSRREQVARETMRPVPMQEASPASPHEPNGTVISKPVRSIEIPEVSQSPPTGFTAVNLKHSTVEQSSRRHSSINDIVRNTADDAYDTPSASNVTIINGKSIKDASPVQRAEMMKSFLTPSEREAGMTEDSIRRSSVSGGTARTQAMQANSVEKPRSHSIELPSASSSTVAIPNTPASLMPHTKPAQVDRDDGGPYKAEMVRRMDNMWKGDKVTPPCDRCRRLHMDCMKNLTACMGCTKKHAKCSWRDVKADELDLSAIGTPQREGSPAEAAPPLSANSTIEVSRHDMNHNASIARASLDLAGQSAETSEDEEPKEHKPDTSNTERPRSSLSTGKFDLRPPPLVQQLQHAAGAASPDEHAHRPSTYDDSYSEDDGDRLAAMAARVYRTASQGGHRM